jgi:Putative zinc-finger
MEHAPLRPVPSRPAGPLDPATATREVAAALPALSELEARALGLVALAERPRGEVAVTLGVDEGELGSLLASARKELRRTISVLGGSGWCERAERLISDRLDTIGDATALGETDARRLDVHLRNCPRCVEHERRLVQATDALLATAGVAGPAPAGPVAVPEPPAGPEDEALREIGTEAPAATPGAEPPIPAEEVERIAPTDAQVAAAAEVLVAVRTRRQLAAAVAWNAMVAIAILLTLATIALTVAGILGAEL